MKLKILQCVIGVCCIVGLVAMLAINENESRELTRQAVQKQMEQKTCN